MGPPFTIANLVNIMPITIYIYILIICVYIYMYNIYIYNYTYNYTYLNIYIYITRVNGVYEPAYKLGCPTPTP